MTTTKYSNIYNKKFGHLGKQLKKHEDKLKVIVADFTSTSSRSNVYWNAVRADINKEYKSIQSLYKTWSSKEIPAFYDGVLNEQMNKISNLKSVTTKPKYSITELKNTNPAIESKGLLWRGAYSDVSAGLALGANDTVKLTRLVQNTLVNEYLAESGILGAVEAGDLSLSKVLSKKGTLANNLFIKSKEGKFITIIDKNGNRIKYRITTYADLVSRTAWTNAQSSAVRAVNANYKTDLVRVSTHNTTTVICQQYEGKTMSLSGKDPRFAVLDQSPAFHVNCLHYLSTTFEETLEATGDLKATSDFSLGKVSTPPNLTSFIPISER